MAPENDWSRLRGRIRHVDEQILELVAERLALAAELGHAKRTHGLPIKNYAVEKAVLDRADRQAAALGIPAPVAAALTRLLIDSACRVQEEGLERRVSSERPAAEGATVTILGGHGRMGQWLGRFFEAFGHRVNVLDPRAPSHASPYPVLTTLEQAAGSDTIVLATPISSTPALLERLTEIGTEGLVFDICSLKTPLLDAIHRAEEAGLRVTSVHPLFGPDVESLVGRNIVVCDGATPEATTAAAALFADSAASIVRLQLARHDELMGIVLGLSHLTSLIFNETVARSGIRHSDLRDVASTTFEAQCSLSERVAAESPDLYYEIQAENAFTPRVLETLRATLSDYSQAILRKDPSAFRTLMERGRLFFQHDATRDSQDRPGERTGGA